MYKPKGWVAKVEGISFWRDDWRAATNEPAAFGIAILIQGIYQRPWPATADLTFEIVDREGEVTVSAHGATVTLKRSLDDGLRDVNKVMWPTALGMAREYVTHTRLFLDGSV